MRFAYSQANLAQGRDNQQKIQQEPNTFGALNGIDDVTQTSALDKRPTRKAGQAMGRLMEYLNNPEEQQRTDSWNASFAQSNEGAAFNMAKMNGGMLPEEGGAQDG